jgi:radical SAM superfamily enzyme YgiQ (UPF0313 family)
MIGIPGETMEMIQETINFNRELAPDDLQFSVFYPYPMTELYNLAVERGYLKEDKTFPGYYGRESLLELPTLTREELELAYERFFRLRAKLRFKSRKPWRYRLYRVLSILHTPIKWIKKVERVLHAP